MQAPAESRRIRVLIVAAYPVVRAGLAQSLESLPGFHLVGEAATGDEGVSLALVHIPDVVLLDPDSADVTLQAVAALVERTKCATLVVTGQAQFHERAVLLGAVGVVSKNQPMGLLAKAVARVAAGEIWLDRASTARVLRASQRESPEAARIKSLTRREREVVALIGDGLRNGVIAERLFISDATVRNHLTSILSKLSLTDRVQLAVFAIRHGLVDRVG